MKELIKIKNYIIKKFPKTTLALNKEEFDKYTKDYLLQTLYEVFLHEIIGICGCGTPEDCAKDIAKLLDIFSETEFDTSKDKCQKYFNVGDIYENSLLLFMAYILDDKELLEHGGSIGGAQVTELGKMCKYVFEEYSKLEGDD